MGEKKVLKKKDISLGRALTPLLMIIAALIITIVFLEQGSHIPLVSGASVATIVV